MKEFGLRRGPGGLAEIAGPCLLAVAPAGPATSALGARPLGCLQTPAHASGTFRLLYSVLTGLLEVSSWPPTALFSLWCQGRPSGQLASCLNSQGALWSLSQFSDFPRRPRGLRDGGQPHGGRFRLGSAGCRAVCSRLASVPSFPLRAFGATGSWQAALSPRPHVLILKAGIRARLTSLGP